MHVNTLPTIAIADDDEDARFLLQHTLEKAEVRNPVVTFADGDDLIRFLDTAPADGARPAPVILLLDINMPGCSGFDVLAALRRQGGRPGLRTVVISSSTREQDIARAAALGAEGYLEKFPAPEVLATVVRHFARPVAPGPRPMGELAQAC